MLSYQILTDLNHSFYFKDNPYAFPQRNIVMEEELVPAEDASIIDVSHLPLGATTDAIE